jgi:hypothetical protein
MKRADRKKAVRAWQAEQATAARGDAVIRHRRWFFVVHLSPARRIGAGLLYEVQRLDDDGRGVEVARYTDPDADVELCGEAVPTPVLRSAADLPEGQGCYVDESGWEVTPLGHRVAPGVARARGGQDPDRG